MTAVSFALTNSAVLVRSYLPLRNNVHQIIAAASEWDDDEWSRWRQLIGPHLTDLLAYIDHAPAELEEGQRVGVRDAANAALARLREVDAAPRDHGRQQALLESLRTTAAALDNLDTHLRGRRGELRASDHPADEVDEALMRELDSAWYSFLPTLYLGGFVGFFPANFSGVSSEGVARYGITAELSGRASVFLEYRLAYSAYEGRPGPADDTDSEAVGDQSQLGMTHEFSASAVAVLPWLVGTSDHDDYWRREGMQRGIGIGIAVNWLGCTTPMPGGCVDGITDSLAVGGILDLRVTKEIRPRFRLGFRRTREGSAEPQDGVDAHLMMAFSIDAPD